MKIINKFLYFLFFTNVFLLCFSASVYIASADEQVSSNEIYPYLQNVTTNSIEVSWNSRSQNQGSVLYGSTMSYGMSAQETSKPVSVVEVSSYTHKVILIGLLSNSVYHFQIVDKSGFISADSTFKTAPVYGTPFSFLVFGDIAGNNDNPTSAFYTTAANEAEEMVLHNPKTIAIMTGDQQEDSKDTSWQPEYFLSERNILKNTVIYNVLGNHDAAGIETFDKYFDPPVSSNSAGSSTKTYYSFNYGDVHFVILDGNQSRAVGSEQYKWLVADMASTNAQKADWRIIFTHQPGLSYGGNHGLGDDNGFMNAISALDTAPGVNKNADLIIMGHNHVYERAYRPEGEKRGITWITDGTVGGTPGTPPLSGEYLQYAGPQGYGYIVITASHKNISGTYYYTGDTGDAGVTPIVKDEFIIPIFHGNNQPNFWDRVVNFLKDLVKL